MNRFKGLELVNSVPEELWVEVCNIVRKAENKVISKKKKSKKANWLPEEALQIVKKEKKWKATEGEKKGYPTKRRFPKNSTERQEELLNDQCIKIEENNRRGKTRDLFNKIGDFKGRFCPKIGTIKDINGRDLVDAEEIKKRWKEYMEELYKTSKWTKLLWRCQSQTCWRVTVWWAFGSTAVNKASGCDGIPVEQFKTIKDDAINVLHSICEQIWKTQQWTHDWKRLILIPIPKKGSSKECANHWAIALISHASKVMLKIFHPRLQSYVKQELPDIKAGFRKGRRTRDQIAKLHWII